MDCPVKVIVHVYCDGDTELMKVPAQRAPFYEGKDVVLNTEDEIKAELKDYGFEDDRIEAALEELRTANVNDTVGV